MIPGPDDKTDAVWDTTPFLTPINPEVMESRARDLDEARRLLYMALMVQRTDKYELAATLVNALKHHQKIEASANKIMSHVVMAILTGEDEWVREQIERITQEIEQNGVSPT